MRHRKLLLSAALAATTAAAALTATPAQAATNEYTKDGCTVTALAPYFVSIASNGQKRVRFKLTFDCDAGRTVKFKQNGYDSDVGEGSATDTLLTKSYGPSSGTGWYGWDLLVDHWDGVADPVVELYHRVQFQVTGGGIVGAWSPWIYSPQVNFVV